MAKFDMTQLERAETVPDGSMHLVEMGDGSGTKTVTQKILTKEIGEGLKVGDLEQLQTENKNSLVGAINEAAQSGGGGTAVDILDSKEEIVANTESGKVAGAQAVKEIFAELNDNLGGCSLEQEGGNFYIVGADSVRKKLQGELLTATGEVVLSTTEILVSCGFKPSHIILVNKYAASYAAVEFYTPESVFWFGDSNLGWNNKSNILNVTVTDNGFTLKANNNYWAQKTYYYAFTV